MAKLSAPQYTITFHFNTVEDIERVKDLAEQMIDAVNPDFGYFSAIKVEPKEVAR